MIEVGVVSPRPLSLSLFVCIAVRAKNIVSFCLRNERKYTLVIDFPDMGETTGWRVWGGHVTAIPAHSHCCRESHAQVLVQGVR